MKILVTGGTGFIGSHTVIELQKNGFEVVVVDNLSRSDSKVIYAIKLITGVLPTLEVIDLNEKAKIDALFKKYPDIKGIIHFAAFKAMNESVNRPIAYYRNNLCSLMNVLESMQKNKVRDIVFSSSCSVYGRPDNFPVSENAKIKPPSSPYGNTKQICEEIISDMVKVAKIRAINLRYFNPAGAHDSGLIGESPKDLPTNLVPLVTKTAIGIQKYLKIYGNDYNTPDGTAIRDFIHVMDIAKAHVFALKRMLNEGMESKAEIFNLGSGKGYSVLEVINAFEEISDMKLNYKFVERREGDIDQIWADTNHANKILGWEAKLGLKDIMKSAWKWEVNCSKQENNAIPL